MKYICTNELPGSSCFVTEDRESAIRYKFAFYYENGAVKALQDGKKIALPGKTFLAGTWYMRNILFTLEALEVQE